MNIEKILKNNQAGIDMKTKAQMEKLKNAANGFETIFMNILMKQMRQTVSSSSENFLGSKFQQSTFTDLFDKFVSEKVTDKGRGIGISKMVFDEYKKHLGAESAKVQEKLNMARKTSELNLSAIGPKLNILK